MAVHGPSINVDPDAIHDNVADEIGVIAEKVTPIAADEIIIEDSADSNNKKKVQAGNLPVASHTHTESEISDLDHTDADAIHDNVSGEINAVSEKTTPIGADLILIEDSADSNSKKRIQISNLPGGGDADAIHDNVAGEITAITSKGTPVNADTIVIEDSTAADAKKSVTIGNLPFAAPSHTHTESEISDLDHTDADALHDNVAGEISLITNKTTPIGADLLVIEDSAATNAKKNVLIGSLPFTAPGHTHTESDITDLVHPFMEGWVKGLEMTFASVSTVSIEAGKCRDSANGFNIINTATRTADITTSGLNGLDTGTEAVSTWYALFIIDDSTGSNTEGALLSLSSTAPTLPGGYDVFKRVGWVRNNASGDFIKFIQTRTNDFRKVFYDEEITNLTVLSLGSATIYTGVSLAAFVPPTSLEPILALVIAPDDRGDFLEIRPTGSTMDNATYKFNGIDDKNKSGYGIQETICSNLQNIEYRVTQASDDASIGVVGYYDQL
jgi:stress response protein YsnF